MTNETNNRFSPAYQNIKYYRNEIEYIKKLKCKSKFKSYAFFYLCLLTKAVCTNVDVKNKTSMKNTPNTYIKINDLKYVFGVNSKVQAYDILKILKDKYKAIDYQIINNKIIYISFNIKSQSLPSGEYSRENTTAYNNAMSIKNKEGFILVNKLDFFNTFFYNNYSKGIQDFYIYLRLNTVYNDKNYYEYIPNKLRNKHITLWKPMTIKYNDALLSLYCHQDDLANLFNVNVKTIQRYLKTLKRLHIVSYAYVAKRGTAIILSYLDTIEEKHINKESIKDSVLDLIKKLKKEYEILYSFTKRKFAFVCLFYSNEPIILSENNCDLFEKAIT